MYVTHYICKDESQVLKQAIAEQLANLPANATARDRLRKIGNTLLSLAHFAVWYNTVSGTYTEGENSDDSASRLPRFQLQKNLGTIVQEGTKLA